MSSQLKECVRQAINQYFLSLDGEEPNNIYELMLEIVEPVILESILLHAGYNKSKAAKFLGKSRNTLRMMLDKYQIITRD